MLLRWTFLAGFLGTGVLLIATVRAAEPAPAQPSIVLSRHHHAPIIIRERHGKQVTSTNWSGYAVTGANGSVTDVKASWVVPAANCTSTPTAYASIWTGIDGYSSNTVEQIGTDSDCENGQPVYYAWFEFYPHLSYTVNSFPVAPGDSLSAEVSAGAKGVFTVTLTNETQGGTFSTSAKLRSAKMSSAEWIVEAPWSGGVLPLTDFGVTSFGNHYTRVSDTCYATVNGVSGPIGPFSKGNVFEITMVTKSGAPEAQPSPLWHDDASFSDAWLSSGQ
jgi:hypothetical protein